MSFVTCSQCQIPFCYTGGLVYAGATYPCRATRLRVVPEGTCEAIWFVLFIFVGPVCNLQTYELRGTVMPRLRRVTHLCSSTLSVNCEKAEKDTLR